MKKTNLAVQAECLDSGSSKRFRKRCHGASLQRQPARTATTYQKRSVNLPGAEFIWRFLIHVLPGGFKRIRHNGLLSPALKSQRLAQAHEVPGALQPELVLFELVAAFTQQAEQSGLSACPGCQSRHFAFCAVLAPIRFLDAWISAQHEQASAA